MIGFFAAAVSELMMARSLDLRFLANRLAISTAASRIRRGDDTHLPKVHSEWIDDRILSHQIAIVMMVIGYVLGTTPLLNSFKLIIGINQFNSSFVKNVKNMV